MTVEEMMGKLPLTLVSGSDLTLRVQGGYVSDLLSNVMANAQQGDVWITMQAHQNIVAVASLIGLSAVIVAGGVALEPETIAKARQQQINLFKTEINSFELAGLLYKEVIMDA